MPKFPTFTEFVNPCWDGYQMVGMKTQNGTQVPNCVPEEQASSPADREWGTDSLVDVYRRDTPGQMEAWERNPNCQQCGRKLSASEQQRGDRVCGRCVATNKGRVWGKDSDDEYEEQTDLVPMRSVHEQESSMVISFKDHLKEEAESVTVKSAEAGSYVSEVGPPGMEDWIRSNKARFRKEYGDRADEVLYATAWNLYHKGKSESAKDVRMHD